jgi:hypothetical protein
MAEIQIFSRDGTALTTITATAPREWVLNDVSVCTWKMSLNDPKCREDYLQYGNIVYIQHESLPDWVGLLDSDDNDGRVWTSGRELIVRALSAGILFDYGDMPVVKVTGTAGRIYEQIVERVNSQRVVSTLLNGNIYQGGANRDEALGGSALDAVRNVAQKAGHHWDVSAVVNSGRIALYANWYADRGVRHDRLLTEADLEFTDGFLRETGKIKNGLTGYGDASTQSTRLSVYVENSDSIGTYGRRRGSEVFSGNKQIGTLTENTTTKVGTMATPRRKVRFSMVNNNNLYNVIDLANLYPFHLDNAGFLPGGGFGTNGTVRLLAFGTDDATENQKIDASVEVL